MQMRPTQTKNRSWTGFFVILALAVGAFFFLTRNKNEVALPFIDETPRIDVQELAIFKEGLQAVGIQADSMGFHGFSPDGKYFMFNVFSEGQNPANQPYILKVSGGEVIKLPGLPERGIDDNRYIQLYTTDGMVLYWLKTGDSKTYQIGENVFYGSLSPDGKTYLANTTEGIKKINIITGEVTSFTKNTYDGAYAWFSDSKRILGFKQTGERLTDGAGFARVVGTWDIATGEFVALTPPINSKTFRMVDWVVPDKIARINAGFDDGSHDYLLEIATGKVVDLGDTSGSLMGGLKSDEERGLLAIVGGDAQSVLGSKVMIYKGIEKLKEFTLPSKYFREQVQIVDENTLIYIRKQWAESGITVQELVKLDVASGAESVLKELEPKEYASLSYSVDHKLWVLSSGKMFFTGKL